ncbi:MAG: NAD-dependent protein deacylase, partial [Salinivirgaceae bacterium]
NDFDVEIITQNVDDLHERAGSSKVTHLHGEIRKSRSTADPSLVYDIEGTEINLGDTCEKGSQLRPHIVWFGEAVPAFEDAVDITRLADIFVIIGTALAVYPAAGLVNYLQPNTPIFVINPDAGSQQFSSQVDVIETGAVEGLPILKRKLNQYV